MLDVTMEQISEAFKISWKNICSTNENVCKLDPSFNILKNNSGDATKFGEYSCPTFYILFNSASSKGIPHSFLSETITKLLVEMNKYFDSNNIQYS